jgi:hypothetical protein
MALQEKYTIMCDEVRQEINGKFLLLGMYTPDIAVPQLPIVLPVLTFFVVLTDDRPDNHQFRLSIQHLESGQVVAQGMGGFQSQRPGLVTLPVRISPMQFTNAGAYTFSVHFDNVRDPITHSFNVILNITAAQQPGAQPGMIGGGLR